MNKRAVALLSLGQRTVHVASGYVVTLKAPKAQLEVPEMVPRIMRTRGNTLSSGLLLMPAFTEVG